MKKFALATLLALSTSAAFAGFNGNTAQGGFQGGDQGQQLTVKQALKEAEAKLDARLVEQDRYFANPENKVKWEKERQDNWVNERFCW